jgi:hypothetical protein
MSDRLTPDWEKTAEGAFGATGKKGRDFEIYLPPILRRRGFVVTDFEEDRELQVRGCDITIQLGSTIVSADLKHNLSDKNSFCVESWSTGWLYNKQKTSQLIIHGNTFTEQVFGYRRTDMIKYLVDNRVFTTKGGLHIFNSRLIQECKFIIDFN